MWWFFNVSPPPLSGLITNSWVFLIQLFVAFCSTFPGTLKMLFLKDAMNPYLWNLWIASASSQPSVQVWDPPSCDEMLCSELSWNIKKYFIKVVKRTFPAAVWVLVLSIYSLSVKWPFVGSGGYKSTRRIPAHLWSVSSRANDHTKDVRLVTQRVVQNFTTWLCLWRYCHVVL